jgi:hypothetical protein
VDCWCPALHANAYMHTFKHACICCIIWYGHMVHVTRPALLHTRTHRCSSLSSAKRAHRMLWAVCICTCTYTWTRDKQLRLWFTAPV